MSVLNRRTDRHSDSIENRAHFVLEVAAALTAVVGKDKVRIHVSPFGVYSDMPRSPTLIDPALQIVRQRPTTRER